MMNLRPFVSLVLMFVMTQPAVASEPLLKPFSAAQTDQVPAPWRVVGVPGGKIPITRFSMHQQEGRVVVRVATNKSYGNLVHDLPPAPSAQNLRLTWRWRLDEALAHADLSTKQGDDTPLKVCVLFDMPLENLGLFERSLLRLARANSTEKLPSATLCYVWDNHTSPETLLPNAYTNRVKVIVVNNGTNPLGQWFKHSRDIATDFHRAFGSESDSLPQVMAVLVGGDSDNTAGHSVGLVGDVQLQ